MISTHAVILHRDSELDAPVTLQYVEETLRGSQRRFEGRTVFARRLLWMATGGLLWSIGSMSNLTLAGHRSTGT